MRKTFSTAACLSFACSLALGAVGQISTAEKFEEWQFVSKYTGALTCTSGQEGWVVFTGASGSRPFICKVVAGSPALLPLTNELLASNFDALVLTSDGTDLTLTSSRAGADLFISDQTGTPMVQLIESTNSARGLKVNGHGLFGRGSMSVLLPSAENILTLAGQTSASVAFSEGLHIEPVFNFDQAASPITAGAYVATLDAGFEPDSGGAAIALTGHRVLLSTGAVGGAAFTGTVNPVTGFDIDINLVWPAGSPATTALVGLDIGALQIGTVPPTRSYGARISSAGNGVSAWAASLNGMTQVATTNKLGLGRANTVLPTNSLRAKTSTGQILVMELNSADRYEWDTGTYYPFTNGGAALGKDGNGWSTLILKDTAASFESTLQFTNTGISADNALTLNLLNASRSLTISGSSAINQDVTTTGIPTFSSVVASSSFLPDATGGADIGTSSLGFGSLWMKDTSAAFEDRIVFTSSTTLTADRTLTIDMTDASQTLRLPIGSTGAATRGSTWWGDGSDAFDTGNEVCGDRSLACQTTFTPAGANQTCAFDHGTAGTYFYALCS